MDARPSPSRLSTLIRRISARRSTAICGRPPRERDFQRQYRRKPARCHRTRVSGRTIVMALRIAGNHRYSRMKNERSPSVSRTRPRTFRRNMMSCCRSAAFSASSRLFDLNGKTNRANMYGAPTSSWRRPRAAVPLRSCAAPANRSRGLAMADAIHGRGCRRAHPRQDAQARQATASRHRRAAGGRSDARPATALEGRKPDTETNVAAQR